MPKSKDIFVKHVVHKIKHRCRTVVVTDKGKLVGVMKHFAPYKGVELQIDDKTVCYINWRKIVYIQSEVPKDEVENKN